MSKKPTTITVCLVGDVNVGKSSLLTSYTAGEDCSYDPSVSNKFLQRVTFGGLPVHMQVTELSAHDSAKEARILEYLRCDVVLIPFSVVDKKSFHNAMHKWYTQAQEHASKAIKIFVGTKVQIRDQYCQSAKNLDDMPIMRLQAQKQIAQQYRCKYIECSAMTLQGLQRIFDQSISTVLKKRLAETSKMSCYVM